MSLRGKEKGSGLCGEEVQVVKRISFARNCITSFSRKQFG